MSARVAIVFGGSRGPVVLYAGTSIFIIFEAISAWAPSYPILIVGRAMTGIAAAAITPTVYTIIADTIAYRARGRVMSIASVGFSVSTITGVPLGLWLSNYWSWRGVLWALTAATVVAASTLLIPLRVVDLQEWKPRAASSSVGARLREALNDVRGLAPTWPVTVVSFLAFAGIGLVYTYLAVDLRHRFGWSNGSVIGLFFLYGLASVAGNLAWGRLGDRSGKERAVRVGQITELAALIVLALALWQDARVMLVAALCVFAFGQAYIPNLKALASAVAPELRGRSLAWNNATMYGGMMVGSWGASVGYPTFGLRGLALAGSIVLALAWLAAGAISEAGAEDA